MADTAAGNSSKSESARFSVMRSGREDFGMMTRVVLEVPAQDDLGPGSVDVTGDALDGLVVERCAVVTERAVRLDRDAMSRGGCPHRWVGEVGAQLDLVDHGHEPGLADDAVKVLGLEVRHPCTLQRALV